MSNLIRLSEVTRRTGLSESEIYKQMGVGTFPRPVKMGRRVAWVEEEISGFIAARIAERDSQAAE